MSIKNFFELNFSLFLFNKKQKRGNIKNPNGKKKYGGNKSELKRPKIK